MRTLAGGIAVLLSGLVLAGCSEVEESSSAGYEPARLQAIEGSEVQQVTFTREGAERAGLRTETVHRERGRRVVPYTALVYDADGKTWVYTVSRPLTFQRAEVVVDRVEGGEVLIDDGPPVGTGVVTVGATQVYGAELEIAGGH
ncbi:MAG TPA: hypothetical protein VI006_14130 [Solirubrobacteraceae bacterium]